MENKDEYKTLDIGEAAALHACDFELLRLEPTSKHGQRAFVFKKIKENDISLFSADSMVRLYRSTTGLQVDAYKYFLALKNLKSRVYNDIELKG